jgi:hypothetical protein
MRGAGVVQATRNSWVRRMSAQDEDTTHKSPSSKPLADLRVPEWENSLLDGQDWRIREQQRNYIPEPFTPVTMRHSFPDFVSSPVAYHRGHQTPTVSLDLSGLQVHTPMTRQSSGDFPPPTTPGYELPAQTPKRSAAMFDAALLRAGDGFIPLPAVETPKAGDRGGEAFSIVAEVGRTNSAGNDRDEMEARLMGASLQKSSPLDMLKTNSPMRVNEGPALSPSSRVITKAEQESRHLRGAPPPPLLQGQLSFDPWRIEYAGTFNFCGVQPCISCA